MVKSRQSWEIGPKQINGQKRVTRQTGLFNEHVDTLNNIFNKE